MVDGLAFGADGADSVVLPDPPKDFTGYRALRFFVESKRIGVESLLVIAETGDGGEASFCAEIPLDFQGVRRLVVDRAVMRGTGSADWSEVRRLVLRIQGGEARTDSSEPRPRVAVGDLRLVDAPCAGDRLGDRDLADALDGSLPGLAEVRAISARSSVEFQARVAGHFRGRDAGSWMFEDSSAENDEEALANSIARGEIEIHEIRHAFEGGVIEWNFNPTRLDASIPFNRQWEFHLNRMDFWRVLARRYRIDGDERLARAWAEQLTSFLETCPYDSEPEIPLQSSHWSTLRAAMRMAKSWPDAFESFCRSAEVGDGVIVDFVKSCLEHGRHLRANHHHGANNHQVIELHGLYTLGCFLPEFTEAKEWRSYVIGRLPEIAARVFGPDGFTRELSSSYHKLSLLSYVGVIEVATESGFLTEIPDSFQRQVERAFDACLGLVAPDGKLPPVNDSSRPSGREILRRGLKLYPERHDFRFAVTGGAEGCAPESVSSFLPYAGFAALRSGFAKDDNLLVFDVGPLGSHHQHQDKLNVLVWAHGRELLYDGGGGSYEASRFRRYAIDTYSHNTVLVDGLAQRRCLSKRMRESSKPIRARFSASAMGDFVCGTFKDPYGKGDPLPRKRVGEKIAKHHRRVLFLKPDVFLVVDDLEPRDWRRHHYQARWHLKSVETHEDSETLGVVTRDTGKPNLAVVPVRSRSLDVRVASGERDPEILGVHVLKHRHAQEDASTVLHSIRGRGRAMFWTLLLPLRPGEVCPIREIQTLGKRGARAFLHDGRTWEISVEPGVDGEVSISEISEDGIALREASSREARSREEE